MPKVINKTTGETVAQLPYDQSGENIATDMAANDPSLDVQFGENADYSPGGSSDARDRMVNSPFPSDVGAPIAPVGVGAGIPSPMAGEVNPNLGGDVNKPALYNKGGKVKKVKQAEHGDITPPKPKKPPIISK